LSKALILWADIFSCSDNEEAEYGRARDLVKKKYHNVVRLGQLKRRSISLTIAQVQGSGTDARVTEKDVTKYYEEGPLLPDGGESNPNLWEHNRFNWENPAGQAQEYHRGLEADVIAKLESFNPGGSVKDRIAESMIDAEELDESNVF